MLKNTKMAEMHRLYYGSLIHKVTILFSALQKAKGKIKSFINAISRQCHLPCHVVHSDGI